MDKFDLKLKAYPENKKALYITSPWDTVDLKDGEKINFRAFYGTPGALTDVTDKVDWVANSKKLENNLFIPSQAGPNLITATLKNGTSVLNEIVTEDLTENNVLKVNPIYVLIPSKNDPLKFNEVTKFWLYLIFKLNEAPTSIKGNNNLSFTPRNHC